MDATNSSPLMHTPLTAAQVRVVPLWDGETLRVMGKKRNARNDNTLAEVDGPWGSLRISIDGYPVSIRAQIDGHMVATLTAVSETLSEEGPVPTFTDRDVPVVLGDVHAGVRFVAEGSRLRAAGRRRFLRITSPEQVWTYGSTQTQTASDHPLSKVLGSINAATELRRGPDPAAGALMTSWRSSTSRDAKGPSGRSFIALKWADGTTVSEIVLTLLLFLGTNDVKLMPLWWRGFDAGGAY